MNQMPLFDPEGGEEAAEEAIERVEEHANPDWKQAAFEAVERVAREKPYFTTDHVWAALYREDTATHEPRAMGAIMRQAQAAGICRKAAVLPQKSALASCHRRPKQVWQSLLCQGAGGGDGVPSSKAVDVINSYRWEEKKA